MEEKGLAEKIYQNKKLNKTLNLSSGLTGLFRGLLESQDLMLNDELLNHLLLTGVPTIKGTIKGVCGGITAQSKSLNYVFNRLEEGFKYSGENENFEKSKTDFIYGSVYGGLLGATEGLFSAGVGYGIGYTIGSIYKSFK